jgi:hypothetical protein
VHDEVGQCVVPSSHVYSRAGACADPGNSFITSKFIVITTEKGVDSQMMMLLEKIQN